MQDYTYQTTGNDAAFLGTFLISYTIFLVIAYLVSAFLLSKVFVKAGKPAWTAFVPIYNGWVLFEIAGKPGWWVLSSFIPLLAAVLYLIASLELAKRFGKGSGFGVLALWFFPIVGYIILAFDDSKYQSAGNATVPETAPSAKPEVLGEEKPSKNDNPPTPPPLVQ